MLVLLMVEGTKVGWPLVKENFASVFKTYQSRHGYDDNIHLCFLMKQGK